MSFHLFPPLAIFLRERTCFCQSPQSGFSSLCFCDSQPLWMKGKRNRVGANRLSLQKEALRVMSPSTQLISFCHCYPTPPANPEPHTGTQTLEQIVELIASIFLWDPPPPPQCRMQRAGGGEGNEHMSRIVIVFLHVKECGLLTIKPTIQSYATWQYLGPVE